MVGDQGFDFGQGFDLSGLLAQAQAMQAQFQRAQEDLASHQVSGSAGGGVVRVTVTGTGELVKVEIDPQAWDADDPSSLGDLIVAAVRDANHKVAILAQATLPPLPGLPGLGG